MSGKILVLGGSGNVGRPLVKKLVSRGASVKAASRSGGGFNGAEGVVFDYSKPSMFKDACEGVDRAYLMIPTGFTGAEVILRPIIQYAAEHDISVVLHTALEVSVHPTHAYAPVEKLVSQVGGAYAVVRPGWYMENFDMFWRGELKHGKLSLPVGDAKLSWVAVDDIAESAASVLMGNKFQGQAYNITGPEALSFGEALSTISNVIGRDIKFEATSDDETIQRMVARGSSVEDANFYVASYRNVKAGYASGVSGDVDALTGRCPQSLRDFVARNRHLFG